jgi:hypothetical protein
MTDAELSRRGLLGGLGAIAGGALLHNGAQVAEAAPGPDSDSPHVAQRNAPPAGLSPLGSPLVPGVTYLYRNYNDAFLPSDFAGGRQFGFNVTTFVWSNQTLRIGLDTPFGAKAYDFEVYAYNNTGSDRTADLFLWQAGGSTLVSIASVTFPSSTSVQTQRVVVDPTKNGPYPPGTRLVANASSTSANFGISGLRLGMTNAPCGVTILPTPARVYDTRPGSPITGGHTRSVNLATRVPAGARAAIVELSLYNTVGHGALRAGAGPSSLADAAAWARSGDRSTTTVIAGVSGARHLTILSHSGSGNADFTLDLVGYVI